MDGSGTLPTGPSGVVARDLDLILLAQILTMARVNLQHEKPG